MASGSSWGQSATWGEPGLPATVGGWWQPRGRELGPSLGFWVGLVLSLLEGIAAFQRSSIQGRYIPSCECTCMAVSLQSCPTLRDPHGL